MTESMGAFEFYLQETLKDLSENGKQNDLKPEQGTAIKSRNFTNLSRNFTNWF